jgi:MFS family permease
LTAKDSEPPQTSAEPEAQPDSAAVSQPESEREPLVLPTVTGKKAAAWAWLAALISFAIGRWLGLAPMVCIWAASTNDSSVAGATPTTAPLGRCIQAAGPAGAFGALGGYLGTWIATTRGRGPAFSVCAGILSGIAASIIAGLLTGLF